MRGLLAAWIARGRARRSPPPPRSSPAEDGTDHSRAGYSLRNRIRQAFIRLLAGSVGGSDNACSEARRDGRYTMRAIATGWACIVAGARARESRRELCENGWQVNSTDFEEDSWLWRRPTIMAEKGDLR